MLAPAQVVIRNSVGQLQLLPARRLLNAAELEVALLIEEKDAVGVAFGQVELVQRVEDGDVLLGGEGGEVLHDPLLLVLLEGKDRLVHHQTLRAVEDGEGDDYPLQLPLAQLLRLPPQKTFELQDLFQLGDELRILVLEEAELIDLFEQRAHRLLGLELHVLIDE